jgi:hypothetical protein
LERLLPHHHPLAAALGMLPCPRCGFTAPIRSLACPLGGLTAAIRAGARPLGSLTATIGTLAGPFRPIPNRRSSVSYLVGMGNHVIEADRGDPHRAGAVGALRAEPRRDGDGPAADPHGDDDPFGVERSLAFRRSARIVPSALSEQHGRPGGHSGPTDDHRDRQRIRPEPVHGPPSVDSTSSHILT